MKYLFLCICSLFILSCQQHPQKSSNTSFSKKTCVVKDIKFKGPHSTIEPDPYWEITTDCQFVFTLRRFPPYKVGDTLTYYVKER